MKHTKRDYSEILNPSNIYNKNLLSLVTYPCELKTVVGTVEHLLMTTTARFNESKPAKPSLIDVVNETKRFVTTLNDQLSDYKILLKYNESVQMIKDVLPYIPAANFKKQSAIIEYDAYLALQNKFEINFTKDEMKCSSHSEISEIRFVDGQILLNFNKGEKAEFLEYLDAVAYLAPNLHSMFNDFEIADQISIKPSKGKLPEENSYDTGSYTALGGNLAINFKTIDDKALFVDKLVVNHFSHPGGNVQRECALYFNYAYSLKDTVLTVQSGTEYFPTKPAYVKDEKNVAFDELSYELKTFDGLSHDSKFNDVDSDDDQTQNLLRETVEAPREHLLMPQEGQHDLEEKPAVTEDLPAITEDLKLGNTDDGVQELLFMPQIIGNDSPVIEQTL